MRYSAHLEKHQTQTHQSKPIPGREQDMILNDAGGYNFKTSAWAMLDRFLIIGTEGGTYYIGEHEYTVRNAENVIACIKEDGSRVIDRVIEISQSGRAASNDPAIFVLALAISPKYADYQTRQLAAYAIPKVLRTGTHLFTFVDEVNRLRGWGKLLRNAVANWYDSKSIRDLGYQVAKYRSRKGWTHLDVLRKAHPSGATIEHKMLYDHLAGRGYADILPAIIVGSEVVKQAKSVKDVISVILEYKLTHEMVPNEWKKYPEVWEALLYDMPVTALIRNLGNMTNKGLLVGGNAPTRHVVDTLLNEQLLIKRRVHPITVLKALKTYRSGKGARGKLSWAPVTQISDALEDAFYLSFGAVQPTGKRLMLGIDVSGSMYSEWHGPIKSMANMVSSEVVSAMMMVNFRTERYTEAVAFADQIRPFNLSRNDSLDDVMRRTRAFTFGRTDCAQPMIHALNNGIEADAFVIYTDGDTWVGGMHPMQALNLYRDKTGIDAKLIVVNTLSQKHSIADPLDPGTLDVVGFDTGFPRFLSNFIVG